MGFLKGRLTFRRYRVVDPLPDDFRDRFEQAFTEHAFREKHSIAKGEETVGWVRSDNLLQTDFSDRDKWLYTHYVMAGMRMDKKTLPMPLVRAMVEQRIADWCEENGRAKAPASVRADIRSHLESDMLARTLPTVKVVQFCWHLAEGWILFENTSDRVNDSFRTLVRNAFGIALEPFSPLEFLADTPALVDPMAAAGMTIMSGGGR
jgi:DNA recombination-dependent growth factor C